MVATAAPHVMRFGRRLGMLAPASFAAAGVAGLSGVAEMFESLFPNSSSLEWWGKWVVRAAGGFVVVGSIALKLLENRGTASVANGR